jgi:acetoin utilization deacetylase AcuC-like enzyme
MLPAIRNFDPQLIIISAGFDAHRLDPLAGLNLEDSDFEWITTELVRIADTACEGRIVSILEGGYSLEALTYGNDRACACIDGYGGRLTVHPAPMRSSADKFR